jgi:hypothetical protein
MQGYDLRTWCPRCRQQVALTNLRSWPEGILVIGDCPTCKGAVASSRPIGWTPNGNGAPAGNGAQARNGTPVGSGAKVTRTAPGD